MVGLREGRAPHRHQLIADVIDQHAPLLDDAIGERAHHVADPLERARRAELIRDPAESADIAKQNRDFDIASLEQIGLDRELVGQLRREELLELHARRQRLLLLIEPGQSGRHAAGQGLDDHRLQLADRGRGGGRADVPPIAVERPDHLPARIENRRDDDRLHIGQAVRIRQGIGRRRRVPERAFRLPHTGQHSRTRPGIDCAAAEPRTEELRASPPLIAIGCHHTTRIQPHELNDGLRRPFKEIRRAGGALQHFDHGLQPGHNRLRRLPRRRQETPRGIRSFHQQRRQRRGIRNTIEIRYRCLRCR
jgi:hypothetical protein